VLAVAEATVPATYAAVRVLAVFIVAAHAHIQGDRRGIVLAVLTAAVLVPIAFIADSPIDGGLLAFCETLFVGALLGSGVFLGRARAAESTERLRARELSRRVMEAEGQVRRRVAQSIHDGPVQELTSMDMMLATAEQLVERGEGQRAAEILAEARTMAERNIGTLRDEIVSLGPYGLDELTLDAALEECVPGEWRQGGRASVPSEMVKLVALVGHRHRVHDLAERRRASSDVDHGKGIGFGKIWAK